MKAGRAAIAAPPIPTIPALAMFPIPPAPILPKFSAIPPNISPIPAPALIPLVSPDALPKPERPAWNGSNLPMFLPSAPGKKEPARMPAPIIAGIAACIPAIALGPALNAPKSEATPGPIGACCPRGAPYPIIPGGPSGEI